jgi:branched-chain amino acid transport system substrate-binding protein
MKGLRLSWVATLGLGLATGGGWWVGGCDDDEAEVTDVGDAQADVSDAQADVSDASDLSPEVATDAGVEPIVIGGSTSLTGPLAAEGHQQAWGAMAIASWVNDAHGGVLVGGVRRPLEINLADDTSVPTGVEALTQQYCADGSVHFILGPYSTGLTNAAVPITEACNKLLVNVAGASDAISAQGYRWVVQVLSPASAYHRGFLNLVLDEMGSSTGVDVALAYETDPFAASVQAAAAAYAADLGFNVVYNESYPRGAVDQELDDFVSALAATEPDVILGGGRFVDSSALTRVLAAQGVAPSAMSLLVGPANPAFYQSVQECPTPCDYAAHPAEGVAAPAQWAEGVTYNEQDTEAAGAIWFGPSQEEFVALFRAVADDDAPLAYQAAQAGAGVLALVLAIEVADSLDVQVVRGAFGDLEFVSYFGAFDVDATGLQVGHEMVQVQWQEGALAIVWPEAAKTADLVYPMP